MGSLLADGSIRKGFAKIVEFVAISKEMILLARGGLLAAQ
jgi:hypothetical protein